MDAPLTRDSVRQYYGETLQGTEDLRTSACCSTEAMPDYLKPLLAHIEDEVQARFYGCGSPLPLALEGCTVLDLGCGTGRDCYVAAQLVGPSGRVIGVDMTEEQLDVARRNRDSHMDRFGYAEPNVTFHQGTIEDLAILGIADDSVDVVISNCVLNLSPEKEQTFAEIFRVLKPGGELYFSDVFADRRVPEHLQDDPVLRGECLGGALYTEDFRRLLARLGCADHRITSRSPIALEDPELYAKAGMIGFESITVRAFNLALEDICENYGHVAYYRGTLPESPHAFVLDDHHTFPTGLPVPVCGNTAKMLSETRYAAHFDVIGDFSTHYGAFDCGPGEAGGGTPDGACC